MNTLKSFILVISLFWLWQSVSVNYAFAGVYLVALLVFAGVKMVQHTDKNSSYRVKDDKFLFLEVGTVIAIIGLVILATGKVLIN